MTEFEKALEEKTKHFVGWGFVRTWKFGATWAQEYFEKEIDRLQNEIIKLDQRTTAIERLKNGAP